MTKISTNRMHLLVRVFAAISCLAVIAVSGSQLYGQPESSAPVDVAAVQPFTNETTFLVVKVDFNKVELPDAAAVPESVPTGLRDGYRRWAQQAKDLLEHLRSATGGQTVYASIGIPFSPTQWPVFVFFKSSPGVTVESLAKNLKLSQPAQVCLRNDWFVVSPVNGADVTQLLNLSPVSSRDELAAAFAAVANYPIQALLLPPAYVRRTIQELQPQLPRQLGGGSSSVLTDGLSWAALGIDTSQPRAELVVQSASADAANQLAAHLPRLWQSLYDAVQPARTIISPEATKLSLSLIQPEVAGSQIRVRMDGRKLLANAEVLAMVAAAIQSTMDQQRDSTRLKEILLAMHNYHDTYRSFPPRDAVRDSAGKSSLSWRVYLLPYLDQDALFKEFHLDESWDSPHNKALLEKMPDVFKSESAALSAPGAVPPGYTTFLAPVGDDTVFGGTKATKFGDITDGTSNTVALVKVKPELAVPWTAPQDYAFDPTAPASGLMIGPNGRFLAALADGSVLEIRGAIEPLQLLHLFQKSDGQVIDLDKVR
jgi:hypothetical protein